MCEENFVDLAVNRWVTILNNCSDSFQRHNEMNNRNTCIPTNCDTCCKMEFPFDSRIDGECGDISYSTTDFLKFCLSTTNSARLQERGPMESWVLPIMRHAQGTKHLMQPHTVTSSVIWIIYNKIPNQKY